MCSVKTTHKHTQSNQKQNYTLLALTEPSAPGQCFLPQSKDMRGNRHADHDFYILPDFGTS